MRPAMALLGNPAAGAAAVLMSIAMLLVTPWSITPLVPRMNSRAPWFAVLVGGETSLNHIVAVKLLTTPRVPIFGSLVTKAIDPATLPTMLLVVIFKDRPCP